MTVAMGGLSVLTAQTAAADIQGWDWATTASTLSNGSASNEVGFWQAILYSNVLCLTNDGRFGSQTFGDTKGWQRDVLNYTGGNIDGVVGWHTWRDTQNALIPGPSGEHRLENTGGHYYSYYGGAADTSDFYWGGTATSVWKFRQPNGAHNGTWYNATNSLNITPNTPC